MYCILLLVCYFVLYLKQILTLIDLNNSSDLTLAPRLKLVPGLIPASSEKVCLLPSLGIKLLPFKAKLQYWSYVEYRVDLKPAKVMCSSQRRFELHTAFVGRSRSLLLTLESTFTSLFKFHKQIIVQELVGKWIPRNDW